MSVSEYLQHRYKPIPGRTKMEAVEYFVGKYGYHPAPVFGPAGCQDAIPSNYVPAGYYLCGVREDELQGVAHG